MSMMWVGVGTVAVGAAASAYSADKQRSASNNAADAQERANQLGIDTQLEMFYKSLEQYKPFYNAGVNALSGMQNAPSGAEAPTLPSPDIKFEFDPNDQMYKIQQEEGEESINRALAARGMYNSRPGINALSDFNRKLIAQETQNQYGRAVDQYGREYSSAIDKFNIENTLAQQNYGKYQDIVKLGAGAASSMGQNALSTGQGVASQYGQIGNAQAQGAIGAGQAQAGLAQDIGALPTNTLASYYYGQQAGLWGKQS